MYKVLVVEDETMIRKGLIFTIPWTELDCIVVGEAGNGVEGMEKIKELNPDVVIVDINMPLMDGFEMIKQTSSEYIYSAIIVSGYNEFEYAKRAIRYGVSEYLLKPVDHEEMREAIKNACQQVEMRKLYVAQLENNIELRHIRVLNIEVVHREHMSYLVRNMIEYIERNYHTKIVMDDLVNEFSSSTTLMNQKFKKETSYTFNDFLNRYRIQMALNRLQEHKEPIYQIAVDCGFSDYKYFHIVFKKYIGCSPKEFVTTIAQG